MQSGSNDIIVVVLAPYSSDFQGSVPHLSNMLMTNTIPD